MTLVVDPSVARADPALPALRLALDPHEVKRRFKRRLPRLAGDDGLVRVREIRVVRHKPGRRCLVEYVVEVERDGLPPRPERLLGKVRARRYGKAGYDLADSLWRAGFDDESEDAISIPEPIATVADFRMWLQRKAPGCAATELLGQPDDAWLGRRVAEAAHKIHEAGVPADQRHTVADELRILDRCLGQVASERRRLAARIAHLLTRCERLAARIPAGRPRPIHRDFYADQVIVDGSRLYVVDLDLYCTGDAALDIGNFSGHVTEQALRVHGDPEALAAAEDALVDRYCELRRANVRPAVRAWATLTLARHVYLSAAVPGRSELTEPLLALCEERVARTFRAAAA